MVCSYVFLYYSIKQKDNSVWILTGTICPIDRIPPGILAWNAGQPKNQTLTNTRKEGIYGKIIGWNSINSIVSIPLGLLDLSADRPERQVLTRTLKEGAYRKIIGWVVSVSEE